MHLRVCHFRRNHVIPGNFNHKSSMRAIGHDFNARLDYSQKYSRLTEIGSEKIVFFDETVLCLLTGSRAKEFFEFTGNNRLATEVALVFITLECVDMCQLMVCFDPFGDHAQAEIVGK